MSYDRRIQRLLLEVNFHRRLWRAWNESGETERPKDEKHYAITHMFLYNQIKDAFFFRLIIRLFALLEEDEKTFSFGLWLKSLKIGPIVQDIQKKYADLLASEDFKKLRKNRHAFFAHNALKPPKLQEARQSYHAVFEISRKLEYFYDEIANAGFVQSLDWSDNLDPRLVHISNCRGGIEQNVKEFFEKLEE